MLFEHAGPLIFQIAAIVTSALLMYLQLRNGKICSPARNNHQTQAEVLYIPRCRGRYRLHRSVDLRLSTLCVSSPFAGIAACNIGGVTIHSFAGIGLGRENAEQLTTKVKKNKKASARWLRTKVLIIDEGALRLTCISTIQAFLCPWRLIKLADSVNGGGRAI